MNEDLTLEEMITISDLLGLADLKNTLIELQKAINEKELFDVIVDSYKRTLRLSGCSLEDYNNALLHFRQWLSQSKLSADDLNVMAELNPYFMQILATKLECKLSELRQKAMYSKISINDILETLVANEEKIINDFKKIRHTFYDHLFT